jgi:prephenate dehydrogenase
VHFRKTALIGVGLLGGSLGLALQKRKLSAEVVGYVRREASVETCVQLGVVTEATMDLAAAVTDADLIVFCTPLAQMRDLAEQAAPHLKPGAIVTDVGSVKGPVVAAIEPIIAATEAVFIGSHPMAGSEQSGPSAAREDLYDQAVCIVTPTSRTPEDKLAALEDFWQAVGSRVLRLTPDVHDNLTSRCSHLPHIVAAGLANYVLSPAHPDEQSELCATGFRDTTRIAAGSPEMWRDIVMMNRKHLQRVLGVFVEDLQEFSLALEREDDQAVTEFFEIAKQRRDQWQTRFDERNQT